MIKRLISTTLILAIFLSSVFYCVDLGIKASAYFEDSIYFNVEAPEETGDNETFTAKVNVFVPEGKKLNGLKFVLEYNSYYLDYEPSNVAINQDILSATTINIDMNNDVPGISDELDFNFESMEIFIPEGKTELFTIQFGISEFAKEEEIVFTLYLDEAYYYMGVEEDYNFSCDTEGELAYVWIGERFKTTPEKMNVMVGQNAYISWNKDVSFENIEPFGNDVFEFHYTSLRDGKIKGLKPGSGTIQLLVDKTQELHTIFVEVSEINTKLKSMTVSNATISPAFNPDTLNYTATVPYDTDILFISAQSYAQDIIAVTVDNNELVAGETTSVTITVEPTNPSSSVQSTVYTIDVYREPLNQNDNAELSTLTVSNATISPAFDPSVFQYTATVPYNTEQLVLSAEAKDSNATVKIDNPKLVVGGTTSVTVTVTAEDGITKFVYNIDVTRQRAPYPTKITSSQYTVGSTYISKIAAGTTVSQLLNGMNDWQYIQIRRANGVVATATETVKTGFTVCLMHGSTLKQSLTVVVTGDADGDGEITIADMIAIKAHVLKKSILSGVYAIAADTTGDDDILINDFIQVKAKILGKGTITAR